MLKKQSKVIVILGPTSGGKTKVGVNLAIKFDGEIISADSRQVYIGMDVGTGKDLREFKVQSLKSKVKKSINQKINKSNNKYQITNIKYHLIDVVKPTADFNVAKYQKLAYAAIEDVLKRGKVPIVVGGTGLYINAVIEGYEFTKTRKQENKKTRKQLERLSLDGLLKRLKKIDLKTYKIIDKQNRRRVQRALEIYYETGKTKSELMTKKKPPYNFLKIGLVYPQEIINKRIDKRLEERLKKEGMVAEVKRLHQKGISWKRLEVFGLEYKWISLYLRGKIGYDEMVLNLSQAIKNFSKRQMTWFRRDKEINWLNDYNKIEKLAKPFLK